MGASDEVGGRVGLGGLPAEQAHGAVAGDGLVEREGLGEREAEGFGGLFERPGFGAADTARCQVGGGECRGGDGVDVVGEAVDGDDDMGAGPSAISVRRVGAFSWRPRPRSRRASAQALRTAGHTGCAGLVDDGVPDGGVVCPLVAVDGREDGEDAVEHRLVVVIGGASGDVRPSTAVLWAWWWRPRNRRQRARRSSSMGRVPTAPCSRARRSSAWA
ncbi:hypothetical protein ACFZBU_38190 [Embleya sp. NPDC008237]|uniref:hypothetical protein n=1 Tax=Embleya sp. NPDC008237 TaxID=3363978 RepID=UPI0036DFF1AE